MTLNGVMAVIFALFRRAR